MLHFSSLIRDVHTVYAAVNFFANISGQVYKQPTVCESTPYFFLFCLKMFDIELCVYGIRDAVESVLAVGYSCEEVRQSVWFGFTEEGHLAYTSVPAQQSSDTITAAGPIPFTIN